MYSRTPACLAEWYRTTHQNQVQSCSRCFANLRDGRFGGSGHALSMHRDVMEADPSDESSKATLVDELKSRGNAA